MSITKDKHYYFPTMTKNIMFTRGVKYIWTSKHYRKNFYGKIFTLYDFRNNDWRSSIEFLDENDQIFCISCFDCGCFSSLNKLRNYKLKKLNEHKT